MRIKDLIEVLQQEDPERIVICQKDAEGNSYSPLYQISTGAYKATTTWYGEAGLDVLTDELRNKGFTDLDIVDGVPAIFLVPVN